jgi:hypothetical protein
MITVDWTSRHGQTINLETCYISFEAEGVYGAGLVIVVGAGLVIVVKFFTG